MSQYAKYKIDSPNYDTTRVPIGLEIILGCLTRTGIPLGEQAVLNVGFGDCRVSPNTTATKR